MAGKLPENYEKFYQEYEQLCRKHKLMIISEGEQVTISDYEDDLWQVKESTIYDLKRRTET